MYRLSSTPASCSSSVAAVARSIRNASGSFSRRPETRTTAERAASEEDATTRSGLKKKHIQKQKQKQPQDSASDSTLVWRNPKFSQYSRDQTVKHAKDIIKGAGSSKRAPILRPGIQPRSTDPKTGASFLAGILSREKQTAHPNEPILRAPSTTLQKFEAAEPSASQDQEAPSLLVVSPGDYIETRRNDTIGHGVILAEEWMDNNWRLVTLSADGEIWKPLKTDVMFVVPGAASRDLVSRCGTDIIAQRRNEILARVELLRVMRSIDREVIPLYHGIQRTARQVYESVALEDEWTTITLNDAAGILQSRKLNIIWAMAVHKVLMGRSLEFVADLSYQSNGIVHVRPRSHLRIHEKAMAAIRSSDGALRDFVAKAKPFILANRERQNASWTEEPSAKPYPDQPPWTEDDLAIIDFLRHSVRQTRSNQIDPYLSGSLTVLRALQLTTGDIDEGQVWDVLVDLGVIAPWQDLVSLEPDLVNRPGKVKSDEVAVPSKDDDAVQSFLKKQGLHFNDPLDGIRHDFGSMPVYVIDDVGAEELDDGISIEPIPNEPGNIWVHTHVADPASVLPPTHPWSIEARRRLNTVYFNHQTMPLLDPAVMRLASLGSSITAGKPERVITFSAKIDKKGNLLDHKVRAGLVRNVKVLRYDALDEALGLQFEPCAKHSYPFEGATLYAPSPSALSLTELDDLRHLYKVSQRLVRQRYDKGVVGISKPQAQVLLHGSPPTHPPGCAMQYDGFPHWTYRVQSGDAPELGSRSMVAESMKVAGRVASIFFRDRGIPAIRRALPPPIISDLPELLKRRSPQMTVSPVDLAQFEMINLHASYSLEPMEHYAVGVESGEGYCRATSPLRRYADLVLHWQLHAALLRDAGLGSKLVNPDIFTSSWLNDFKTQLSLGETRLKVASKAHDKFWQAYYLKSWLGGRYRSEEEKQVENVFDACLLDGMSGRSRFSGLSAKVIVPKLALQADLNGLREGELAKLDWTKVKIQDVVLGGKPRIMLARVQ